MRRSPRRGACELGTALLVPGYTGSKEDFLPILGEFAYGGRRVLAIDQRGQYETPGPDDPAAYDLAELGKDVAALLDGDQGDSPARPLIWRPGGPRGAAGRRGAGRVDYLDEPPGPGAIPGDRAAELRSFLDAVGPTADPEQFRATVAAIWYTSRKPQAIAAGLSPAIVDFLQDRMLGNSATGLVAMARQLLAAPDLTEELAKLDIPVFVLYGEDDDAWPAEVQEDMAALLEARRECIPGAAHSPAVEAPATTAHALTDFWNFTESSGTAPSSRGCAPSPRGLTHLGEAIPGTARDGGALPRLAMAQVVAPSAPGTSARREHLILPAAGSPARIWPSASAHSAARLSARRKVPGERLVGVLPRDHLATWADGAVRPACSHGAVTGTPPARTGRAQARRARHPWSAGAARSCSRRRQARRHHHPRRGVQPVDAAGYGDQLGAGRDRPLHADWLVGRVEGRRRTPRPSAVPSRGTFPTARRQRSPR